LPPTKIIIPLVGDSHMEPWATTKGVFKLHNT